MSSNELATTQDHAPAQIDDMFSDARVQMIRDQVAKGMLDRFWKHVDRSGTCWEWTAYRNPTGYGQFVINSKLKMQAHRFIDAVMNGPHAQKEYTLHICDNPACVRPSHLFRGTQADNMTDKKRKGRAQRGEQIANSRLKEDDVISIRSMREKGDTYQSIADHYGLSIATVYAIVQRTAWAHIK